MVPRALSLVHTSSTNQLNLPATRIFTLQCSLNRLISARHHCFHSHTSTNGHPQIQTPTSQHRSDLRCHRCGSKFRLKYQYKFRCKLKYQYRFRRLAENYNTHHSISSVHKQYLVIVQQTNYRLFIPSHLLIYPIDTCAAPALFMYHHTSDSLPAFQYLSLQVL